MGSSILEGFSGLGDLEVSRKDPSLKVGKLSTIPNLINQFPAQSVYPSCKRLIVLTVPEDA